MTSSNLYSTWTDSLYWLKKRKLTSQAKFTLAIAFLIGAPFVVPWVLSPSYSTGFALTASAIMVAYLFVSQFFFRRIRRSFGNAVVCAYRHVATPFTSMFSALKDEKVLLPDIARLVVETGKFSNLFTYLNGDGKILMQLHRENPDTPIHIFGLNDLSSNYKDMKQELAELGAPQIIFHDTRFLSVAHRNIIKTKDGRNYLWFEEHHEIENGHHYFPCGAFLFKIDESVAVQIENDLAAGVQFKATRAA